jgi:NAD(P)-binding Rossmann-like domain
VYLRRHDMGGDPHRHERSYRGFETLVKVRVEHLAHRLPLIRDVASLELRENRLLAWKVLIQRRNVDARAFGDAVRRQLRRAVPHQNVSRRLENRVHSGAGTLLNRLFSRRKLHASHVASSLLEYKLRDTSRSLHYVVMTPSHVSIIGGGVAGLVTAIALRRAGITSTVYEAWSDSAEDAGAFFTIATNGLRALRSIDCLDAVVTQGFLVPTMKVWSGTGRLLGERAFFGAVRDPSGSAWWLAQVPTLPEPDRAALRSMTPADWQSRLLELAQSDRKSIAELIATSEGIYPATPGYSVPPIPVWSRDGMIVIGDAAHAVGAGQGASARGACARRREGEQRSEDASAIPEARGRPVDADILPLPVSTLDRLALHV